ncbi:MAG: hypothetical protein HRU14_13995, partial [Planctomycetes bacterium]|nr:hypothetical protein [Planctomycetota bacterium]
MPFPATGTAQVSLTIADLALAGQTFYSVGVFLDSSGVLVSNGVSLTFVLPGADAGPDAATFVGQAVTLDGSPMLNAAGVIPSGTNPAWTVTSAPAGSAPQLQNDQGAFPVFSADMAGTYTIELQTMGPGGLSADTATVDVFNVQFSSATDGAFVSGPVALDGTIDGPPFSSLDINGSAAGVVGNAFSAGTLMPTPIMNPITASVTTVSGQVLERTITVINGAAAPMGSLGTPGTALRMNGPALDAIEPPVETALAQLPLNALFTAIPTIPIIPSGIFTANLTFTGASFDPTTVDFDLFPANCAIGVAITLNTLSITADITGTQLFGGAYSETATITADSVIITGEMIIALNAQGGIETTLQNTSASFVNFNMQVTGILGLFFGLVQPAVETALATAFESALTVIPTALNPVLAGLALTVDLSASGIPMQIDLPLNSVCYDTDGLTLANDILATPTQTSPTAPAITDYLTTPGSVPTFGPTTAVNGVAYDFALGVDDELMNQSLAALTIAGALDLDLTDLGGTPISASALAMTLPGAGFDAFPASTPVTLRVRQTTAPAIAFSATGDAASLRIGNQRLIFVAEPAAGIQVPVLEVGVTTSAALTITIDPTAGSLTLTPGTITVTATAGGAIAGANATGALGGINSIVQQIVPLITQPLSGIPLPFTGAGGSVVEVSVPGASPSMLLTWLDIP